MDYVRRKIVVEAIGEVGVAAGSGSSQSRGSDCDSSRTIKAAVQTAPLADLAVCIVPVGPAASLLGGESRAQGAKIDAPGAAMAHSSAGARKATISKTLAAARKVAYIRYKDRLCAAIVAMSRKRRKVEFTLTNILGGYQSLISAAAQ